MRHIIAPYAAHGMSGSIPSGSSGRDNAAKCDKITQGEPNMKKPEISLQDSVKRKSVDREFRHGMRGESAKRCIGPITQKCDIFGLTKGDFSMIDILRHIASEIGPCRIDVGTWTAAASEIKQAFDMLNDGNILAMRFLVDRSFPARQPKYYHALRDRFGDNCVRLARFHAKFILLENDRFSVAVRTSMNLNLNERIEFYELSEGSPISGYLSQVMDHHFALPLEDSYDGFKSFGIDEPKKLAHVASPQHRLGGWD